MKHSLMLIESPNKINTITKYLKDKKIKVLATIGHIRELDEKTYNRFGFEEKTYKMKWKKNSYRTFKGRTYDVIEEINKEADTSQEIFLSTDPDREGEAISWHIYSVLNEKNQKKCKRIVFNEITQDAINKAFLSPRDLDQNQINSYLARKILDRGIGFKLSDFARKSTGGESAGRVQSIALRFLKDKDDEIKNFKPEHWFNIFVKLENGLELILKELNKNVNALLREDKTSTIDFTDEEEANSFLKSLSDFFTLIHIEDPKREKRSPPKPFKTSSMQSTAISKLGMSVANVDRIAQKLYEGVEIDGEFISLITYPRTDREDLSDTFISETKNWILKEYGDKYLYLGKKKKTSKTDAEKALLVQGAHEAIRPTYVHMTPGSLEGKIDKQELRLYRLIWSHAVASLMTEALYDNTVFKFDNQGNIFSANHRVEIFDGFQKLFRALKKEDDEFDLEDESFPELTLNKKYKTQETLVNRIDKRPPSPYTESTLIKALEDKGIGRPSTYASIVNTVLKREYAIKDGTRLMITELGIDMSIQLIKYFPNIMEYDYTKNMEQSLDDISENKLDWKQFLDGVFFTFNDELNKAFEQINNLILGTCPDCGGSLKRRYSRKTGKNFIGCDKWPECKYIQRDTREETTPAESTGELCPECGGALVKKVNKQKKPFVGCSQYPKCNYIKRDQIIQEEIGRKCPKCNKGQLFKRLNKWNRPFISCNNFPQCKYIESIDEPEETGELCPECKNPLWKLVGRYNKPYLKCSSENCKFRKPIKEEKN